MIVQYKDYILNLLKGNLGYSIYYNRPVVSIIADRILWTLLIVIVSLIISVILGVFLGSLSAWCRNSYLDKICYSVMIVFSQVPSFLVGIFFLFTLETRFKWIPMAGGVSAFVEFDTTFEYIYDILKHAILPVITLSLARIGEFYMLSRNSMITVLSKDYMKTAKAKGLKKSIIIFRHALKNSIIPIVTRICMSLGSILGGAVLVENVFNYPGIGKMMGEAISVRDYVLLQGIFIVITVLVLSMNRLADIINKRIDPRVN